MVGFKNRYLVMEMFVDPNKEFAVEDPIVITQFNVSKAIKDSIILNFGECGLASSLFSFQGRTDYHDFLLKDLGNFGLAILPRKEHLLHAGNTKLDNIDLFMEVEELPE